MQISVSRLLGFTDEEIVDILSKSRKDKMPILIKDEQKTIQKIKNIQNLRDQ